MATQTTSLTRDSYVRDDLVAFTRTSPEMKYARAEWGKNKKITCKIIEDDQTLGFSEDYSRTCARSVSEQFLFGEEALRRPRRVATENLSFSELSQDREIRNTCDEALIFSESPTRKPIRSEREKFGVIDQDENLPNTVLYDLELLSTPADTGVFETYVSQNQPLNYYPVRPLYAGEYQYKNAVVGFQLNLTPNQGRYGVLGSTLHIDVEDVVAKGRSKVEASGATTVRFAELTPPKSFLTIPQVLTGKVEASEDYDVAVTEISRLGFKVALKSKATGDYIEGTIDWLADGY